MKHYIFLKPGEKYVQLLFIKLLVVKKKIRGHKTILAGILMKTRDTSWSALTSLSGTKMLGFTGSTLSNSPKWPRGWSYFA